MMLHAIQWLPALAWTCERSFPTDRQRVGSVALATTAAFGLLAFSLWQTFEERSLQSGEHCGRSPARIVARPTRRGVRACLSCRCCPAGDGRDHQDWHDGQ